MYSACTHLYILMYSTDSTNGPMHSSLHSQNYPLFVCRTGCEWHPEASPPLFMLVMSVCEIDTCLKNIRSFCSRSLNCLSAILFFAFNQSFCCGWVLCHINIYLASVLFISPVLMGCCFLGVRSFCLGSAEWTFCKSNSHWTQGNQYLTIHSVGNIPWKCSERCLTDFSQWCRAQHFALLFVLFPNHSMKLIRTEIMNLCNDGAIYIFYSLHAHW